MESGLIPLNRNCHREISITERSWGDKPHAGESDGEKTYVVLVVGHGCY